MDRAARIYMEGLPLKNRRMYIHNVLDLELEALETLPEVEVETLYIRAFNARHPIETYLVQSTHGYWSGACVTSIQPLAFIQARTESEALAVARELGVDSRFTLSAEPFKGNVNACPWIKVRNF